MAALLRAAASAAAAARVAPRWPARARNHRRQQRGGRTERRATAAAAAAQGGDARPRGGGEGIGGGRRDAQSEHPCLTSVANERVKRLVKLRTSHRARRETGSALLVGADVIAECVVRVAGDSAVQPRRLRTLLVRDGAEQHADAAELLAAARAQGSARGARVPTFLASDDVMNKVAGVGSADGVVAVAEVEVPAAGDAASAPDWAASMNRVLALDTVQDPGNVGTLLRTALALGWGGALMLGDCCDVFNDKCLRAGRGAAAKLPTLRVGDSKAGAGAALRALQAEGFTVVAAEPPRDEHEAAAARDVLQALSAEHRVCLVLGSEGQGLSAEAKAACAGGSVSVPQDPGSMESLNVGVAGGILMYALGSGAEAAD